MEILNKVNMAIQLEPNLSRSIFWNLPSLLDFFTFLVPGSIFLGPSFNFLGQKDIINNVYRGAQLQLYLNGHIFWNIPSLLVFYTLLLSSSSNPNPNKLTTQCNSFQGYAVKEYWKTGG
jgi:hypothetical protein